MRWLLLGCWLVLAVVPSLPAATGVVVVVHRPEAVTLFEPAADKVTEMLQAGMQELTGQPDPVAAWRQFCSSNDVIGIKINTQAAPKFGTHRALVDAIVAGLRTSGVPATNIWVFDRELAKMRALGFAGPDAPQEVASQDQTGWDAGTFYDNRIAGRLIWGDLLFRPAEENLSTRSHLPLLVTKRCTKIINVPVLQDHEATGLAGCLYNLSLGLVDNTRRFEVQPGYADAPIVEINALPVLRHKTVLHILDGLVGGFAGGPSFKPAFGWQCGRLYLSTDPVAVDALALEQIETQRRAANVPAIGKRAFHVTLAGKLGLGVSERERIQVREAPSDDPRKHQQK